MIGGGEHPCGVTMTDNGESGKTVGRPVIGDNGIQGSAMSSGDAVGGHIHRPLADASSIVGGPNTTP